MAESFVSTLKAEMDSSLAPTREAARGWLCSPTLRVSTTRAGGPEQEALLDRLDEPGGLRSPADYERAIAIAIAIAIVEEVRR